MGYIKRIIDKLLSMQEKLYPEARAYYAQGEGLVSLLRVVGIDGEALLLKCEGGRIRYASGDESPIHIFRVSEDTFLDILSGEETVRDAITLNHMTIENTRTGEIDLVEMQKGSRAVEELRGLRREVI